MYCFAVLHNDADALLDAVLVVIAHHLTQTCAYFLDSDYAIFVWRHAAGSPETDGPAPNVILHLSTPDFPLPQPPDFQNPAFYAFLPRAALSVPNGDGGKARSIKSNKSRKSRKSGRGGSDGEAPGGIPKFMKEFHQFHSENGVRTVKGDIGPVEDGEFACYLLRFVLSRVTIRFCHRILPPLS